ncbi:MAG: aspartate--tRNA(Asn) ligase [Candidatus Blackburnbacteria bacterium]|nr:aspartate--tRNA(Asn) ligase [Candidatus Blackburnbacteria bacterium]
MKEHLARVTEEEILGVVPIEALSQHIGNEVRVVGWIDTIRSQKRMKFILVRDDTGMVQVTIDSQEKKDLGKLASSLTVESAVRLRGKVVKNDVVKVGGLEIIPEDIQVEASSDPALPISTKERPSSLQNRLDWRFLDLRRPENHLIFQLQTTAEHAMREFWSRDGFIEIHSPKIMGVPSESGAELFELKDYFGKRAYLAQSPQFYKQYAIGSGFNRVFEIGPVFRANPSFTSRHDTEFTSVDVEIAWINSHHDVMAFEERWLKFVFERVVGVHGDQIRKYYNTEIVVPSIPFPRLSMEDAQRILKDELGHTPPPDTKPGDLDPQGEKLLGAYAKRNYGHEFVFVVDWPINLRPFYHMRYPDNPKLTRSFDLLWKGLEITTGAQREHRHEVLVSQATEKGARLDSMKFYLDIFKYGTPPHGGYGFGLTRMLMQMLGLKNVREATFLYRGPNRLFP